MRRNLYGLIAVLLLAAPQVQAAVAVKTAALGHGVEAWYAPSADVPVVDVVLSFEGAGAASDPEGKSGRAAFAAAMLTEGAGALSAQEFARQLDAHAITLDMRADADRLTVHVYCLREHAAKAGELLALALTQPTLHAPDLARVKAQFAAVLRMLAERPAYQAERLLATRAFSGHAYANTIYGSQTSLAALGAEDVRSYLAQYVTRGPVIVAAAGDVDAALLETMLKPTLDALKDGPVMPATVPAAIVQGAGETLRARADVPQTAVRFVGPGVARDDPRFYTAYVLNEILGGNTLTSRLGGEVRQKKGLVYGIDTDLEVRAGGAFLTGEFATANRTADEAVAEVKTILAGMRERGVTADECAHAKGYVLGHFPLQLDRSGNVSAMLFTMQLYHLGRDYMEDRVKLFERVRCEDINSLAHELLAPEKFLFAIVGGAVEVAPHSNAANVPPASAQHAH